MMVYEDKCFTGEAEAVTMAMTMTKILLVDDNKLILHSLRKTLKLCGAAVTAVTNGKDAIHEMQTSFYEICFLDVQLTDANGLELMIIIGKMSPKTRIIIMTAVCLNDQQLQKLRGHACYYLPKPFDLDQVRALVSEISNSRETVASKV